MIIINGYILEDKTISEEGVFSKKQIFLSDRLFCQDQLLPILKKYFKHHSANAELVRELISEWRVDYHEGRVETNVFTLERAVKIDEHVYICNGETKCII